MSAPEPHFSRRRSFLYAAILVLGFFGLLEGGLRLVGVTSPARPRLLLKQIDIDISFPFMREDPDVFWSPQPGFSGAFLERQVSINSLGLRGPELPSSGSGRKRLLCFGDSITFGYGLSDEETYPAQLGRLLRFRGVDVVNAGVTGFTSFQVRRYVLRQLEQARPDGITVCIGWNDLTRRQVDDRTCARRLTASMALQGALDRLYIFRAFRAAYLRLSLRGEADKPRDVRRVEPEQYRENLAAIAALCRERGVKLAFIGLPSRKRPADPPRDQPYAEALERHAAELGVPLIDPGDLGRKTSLADTDRYFIDTLHFSPAGAQLFAETLAAQLEAAGVP